MPVKISVVIPAFNEAKLIGATLREVQGALAAFHDRGWTTEIVVCDNNSTDATAQLAQAAGALVVFEPVNQIGRARNKGAAAATGDWLVFIDADTHPSRALLAEVASSIAGGKCIAGGSTIRIESHGVVSAVVGLWNWVSCRLRWAAGSFIFCEATAFRTIGGFSQNLYAGEEIDLSQRLKRLSRSTGQRVIILSQNPIQTSDRKLHLYSSWEHLRFFFKTVATLGRTRKSATACHTWYDGRR